MPSPVRDGELVQITARGQARVDSGGTFQGLRDSTLVAIERIATWRGVNSWDDQSAVRVRAPTVVAKPAKPTVVPDAPSAKPAAVLTGTQRERLLHAYVAAPAGLTDEEAAQATGLVTAWKRCSDLRRTGCIEPTGVWRDTLAGRRARACRITTAGRAWLDRRHGDVPVLPAEAV